MSTTSFSSQGTVLQVKISSSFTTIPGVMTAPIPAIKLSFDDITNLSSPAGFPERIPVGKEFTDVSFPMIFDPTNSVHQFLMTASTTQARCDFQEVLSDSGSATAAYSGYASMEVQADTRKAIRATLTINVDGDISFTP